MGNSFGGTKRPISLPPVARPVTGDGGLTDDDPADLEETEVSQRLSSVRGGVCVCGWEGGGGGIAALLLLCLVAGLSCAAGSNVIAPLGPGRARWAVRARV